MNPGFCASGPGCSAHLSPLITRIRFSIFSDRPLSMKMKKGFLLAKERSFSYSRKWQVDEEHRLYPWTRKLEVRSLFISTR